MKGDDPDNLATNALLIMISDLKKTWHVSMTYFTTRKLNTDILSYLILESMKLLRKAGCLVNAVNFDSAAKI